LKFNPANFLNNIWSIYLIQIFWLIFWVFRHEGHSQRRPFISRSYRTGDGMYILPLRQSLMIDFSDVLWVASPLCKELLNTWS
jgi:hypothetical protein